MPSNKPCPRLPRSLLAGVSQPVSPGVPASAAASPAASPTPKPQPPPSSVDPEEPVVSKPDLVWDMGGPLNREEPLVTQPEPVSDMGATQMAAPTPNVDAVLNHSPTRLDTLESDLERMVDTLVDHQEAPEPAKAAPALKPPSSESLVAHASSFDDDTLAGRVSKARLGFAYAAPSKYMVWYMM